MNSVHVPTRAARLVFGALAGATLLVAASNVAAEPAAAAVAASPPADSDHFAPGWPAHARRLASLGPAPGVPGRDRYVLTGLPHGDYVLVQRVGDKAQLLDTPAITIHGGMESHNVFLESGIGKVYALPAHDTMR